MLLPTGRATSSSLHQKHSSSFRSTSQSPPRVRSPLTFRVPGDYFPSRWPALSSTPISQWFGATTSLRWSFVTVTRKGSSVSRSPTALSRSLSKYPLLTLATLGFGGAGVLLWHFSQLSSELKEAAAIESAARYSEVLAEFRTLYTWSWTTGRGDHRTPALVGDGGKTTSTTTPFPQDGNHRDVGGRHRPRLQ